MPMEFQNKNRLKSVSKLFHRYFLHLLSIDAVRALFFALLSSSMHKSQFNILNRCVATLYLVIARFSYCTFECELWWSLCCHRRHRRIWERGKVNHKMKQQMMKCQLQKVISWCKTRIQNVLRYVRHFPSLLFPFASCFPFLFLFSLVTTVSRVPRRRHSTMTFSRRSHEFLSFVRMTKNV